MFLPYNLFTLLKYTENMNLQVFAEPPTSTVVHFSTKRILPVELHLGANISETWPDFIPLPLPLFKHSIKPLFLY